MFKVHENVLSHSDSFNVKKPNVLLFLDESIIDYCAKLLISVCILILLLYEFIY